LFDELLLLLLLLHIEFLGSRALYDLSLATSLA
jgi:hypothetical protein